MDDVIEWGGTPGPWMVRSEREDDLKVKSAEDDFIADCADGFWSDAADGWVMTPDSERNARAIAKVPEMVAALRKLDLWFNGYSDARFDSLRREVTALVAKLDGEG